MVKTNAERQREYRERHPGIEKKRRQILREEVLTHYGGGECACIRCGEARLACLSIDHINGRNDGGNDKTLKMEGKKVMCAIDFYRKLKREGYPNGYQTLCMNCQWVKRDTNREYMKLEYR